MHSRAPLFVTVPTIFKAILVKKKFNFKENGDTEFLYVLTPIVF